MKNKITLAIAAIVVSTSLMASDSEVIKKIEKINIVKSIDGKVEKLVDHGSLYQISVISRKSGMLAEAFLTKDLSTIIFGDAMDTKSSKQLFIPIDMDIEAVKKVASYSYGNGKNEYFLFTDPECSYCIALEKEIHKLNDDAKVYVVLFPLSFHKNAKSMSRYILSQKTNALKAKAMNDIANGSTAYQKAKYSTNQLQMLNKELDTGMKMAQVLRINSTPSLLSSEGIKTNYQELMH